LAGKLPLASALANLPIRGGLMAARRRVSRSRALFRLGFPPLEIFAQLELQALLSCALAYRTLLLFVLVPFT
jgi:hypothetical protein